MDCLRLLWALAVLAFCEYYLTRAIAECQPCKVCCRLALLRLCRTPCGPEAALLSMHGWPRQRGTGCCAWLTRERSCSCAGPRLTIHPAMRRYIA